MKCPLCGYVRIVREDAVDAGCPACATRDRPIERVAVTATAPTTAKPPPREPSPRRKMTPATKVGIACIGVAVCVFVAALVLQGPPAAQRPRTPMDRYVDNSYRIDAACHSAIKGRLHDPDSVQWDDVLPTASPGKVEVLYQLRAKNGFGAYRRTAFVCEVDPFSLRVTGVADATEFLKSIK